MKITEPVENAVDLDPDGNVVVKGAVRSLSFCPCKWNSSLLAVGSRSEVTIFSLKFPDESPDHEELGVEVVRRFIHVASVDSIAWSPNMSLVLSPVWMRFATASSDGKARIFFSNLQDKDDITVLAGHGGPVNAVAFEPQSGEVVASVADDNSCRIWHLDGTEQTRLVLRSPGTAVAWHPDELGKLLVAEKRGTLRLYNAHNWQPLMSLDTGGQGGVLLSADWSVCNSILLGATAGPSWFLWETARSSRPLDHKTVHPGGATDFRFSHIHETLCATRGYPGNHVKVLNLKTGQALLSKNQTVGCGVSWHHKLPIVAYGGDGRVRLFRVTCI